MRRYFGRKLVIYLLTFWVAATIDWMIPRFMPGDPIQSLLSRTQVAPEAVADLIAYYKNLFGLDVPLWEQYLNFWGRLLQGDLGRSVYLGGRPVADVIMAALPYTLALLVPAILLSWWTGNKAGALAARRQVLDNTLLPVSYILTATPYMWLAIMLAWIFASVLGIFPISGGYCLQPRAVADLGLRRGPRLALVPAVPVALPRHVRRLGDRDAQHDHLRARCRLRPLPRRPRRPSGLVRRYAFRNAVLPQITGLALSLGVIVAGALVTEIVFSYPGIGKLLLAAVQNQDYFLLQGIFLFIIVGVLVANFLVDIAYVVVDPRTRVGMSGGTA